MGKSSISNVSVTTAGEGHLASTNKQSKSIQLTRRHRTKSDEKSSTEEIMPASVSKNNSTTTVRHPAPSPSGLRAPTASLTTDRSASPGMPSTSPEGAARSLPPTPQEGSADRKPWQSHDIPEELGNLRDDTPKEISRIIRESLKEHRATRMSNLQARAILVRTTIETSRTNKTEGKSAAVHCEANVSARSSPSLGDSDASSGSGFSDGSSATTPGSENEDSLLQAPKKNIGLSAHKVSMDSLSSQYSHMSFRSNRSQAPSPQIFASCPRMAVIESKLEESKKRTTDSQKLFRSLPSARRKTPPPPSFFYPRMPETHECAHCFDTVPGNHIVTGLLCRHKYCVPCFSHMVSTAVSSESTFPAQCCGQKFPRAILRTWLPSKALTVFDEKALEYAVPIGQRYYCASPDCARWIDPRVAKRGNGSLECPHCRTAICAVCRDSRHAKPTDCPEYNHQNHPGVDKAGGAGLSECYSCRTSFRPSQGRAPVTCKCQAEICSLCGSPWHTCQCSKVKRGRHEEHRARRRNSDHAHYQPGEREIRSAIVAIEATEKDIRHQQEAEEFSFESSLVKPATMEPQRRQRIVEHFTQLRRLLDSVRYQQRQAIEQRHNQEDRAVRHMVDARDGNIARREKEIVTLARARAEADNDAMLKSLQHKHATALMQTMARHRKAQDEFLVSPSARPPLREGSRSASSLAPDAEDNNLLKANILSNLLRAQEQERLTLVTQQERELRKWRARGEQALQAAESEAREQVLQAKLEEAERIDAEARRLKWKVDADWRWFGVVWDDRKAMLQDDETRLVRQSGILDADVEPLSDGTRGSAPAISPQPSLPNLSRYGAGSASRNSNDGNDDDALPPPPPPLKGRDTYRRSPSQPRRTVPKVAATEQQPIDKRAAVVVKTEAINTTPPPPHPHSPNQRRQRQDHEPASSPRRGRRAPPPSPPLLPSTSSGTKTTSTTTAKATATAVEEPHPGRRIHYGPTTSWMEREFARVDHMREMRGGRRIVVVEPAGAASVDVSPV